MNMVFITNFTVSSDPYDLEDAFINDGKTNLDWLLSDFIAGYTTWSVPKKAAPGDVVLFMCAKTASPKIASAAANLPVDSSQEFKNFAFQEKALYKQYSGNLLGYGIVSSIPEPDDMLGWQADISPLYRFTVPISLDDFRSFITLNSFGSITNLTNDQWERMRWVVNQKNPGTFSDIVPPDADVLNQEFQQAVRQQENKTLVQLQKEALKKASQPVASTVRTQVYRREPSIAAYVKKRANGCCQLCGKSAPFDDQNKEPYLECHHIVWLSQGGMDAIDNCVALCPNCHRKMHVLNLTEDIQQLKSKAKELS